MNIIGKKIIRLATVDSTNDYMSDEIRRGTIIQEGTIIIADKQTKGKGLDANTWESETGKNLTFSVFIKPEFLKAERQFMLNKTITLGIYDFVKSVVKNQKVSIKWPNDIYINNGKVAGILINNTISGNQFVYSIVGAGININQTRFASNAPNPVSLRNYLKHNLDLKECLNSLCGFLNARYQQLEMHNYSVLNSDYLSVLFRLNEIHRYRFGNNIIYARITGVSEYGKLQLLTKNNQNIECDLKEIEFVI